jgi:hypothetical protein
MIFMKTVTQNLKYIMCIFFVAMFASCDYLLFGPPCPGFDFSRLTNDSSKFHQHYCYTNNIDTIKATLSYKYFSKNSEVSTYPCENFLELEFKCKNETIRLYFDYNYSLLENDTPEMKMTSMLNDSHISVNYDSLISVNHTIVLENFKHYDSDSSKLVKRAILENLKIQEIEFLNGEIWKLCGVGEVLEFPADSQFK